MSEQELKAEVKRLKDGIKEFYVVHAPHLPACWREHLADLLGDDKPFLGAIEAAGWPSQEERFEAMRNHIESHPDASDSWDGE